MEKKTKIIVGIIIGLSAAAAITGFILIKKNKKVADGGTSGDTDKTKDTGNTDTGNDTTTSNDTSSDGGGNSGGGSTGGSTSGGTKSTSSSSSGIDSVLSNLGASAKKSKDGTTANAAFNSSKNAVTFYGNGRFAIAYVGTKKAPLMGNWSNGGKTLIAKGKTFSSGSVWKNLQDVAKL